MKKSSQEEYFDEKEVNNEKLFKVTTDRIKYSPIHRAIGALTALDAKKNKVKGTAFLISKKFIMTTAHNIFDKQTQTMNTDFKFYLAANGLVGDYYEIQSWRYPSQFHTCPNTKKCIYDYALMKLKDNPSKPVNYNTFCELSLACQCSLPNIEDLELQIYGYPSHFSFPNYTPHDKQQTRIELYQYGLSKVGRVDQFDPNNYRLTYRMNTYPGQSGSPVISYGNIIGIHVGGLLKQANIGRLITPNLIQKLKQWCSQLGGSFQINFNSICSHNQNSVYDETMATALLHFLQGDKSYKSQDFKAALTHFTKALTIRERIMGKKSVETAQVIAYIGTVYNRLGDYGKALSNLHEGLNIYNAKNKKDSLQAAKVVNNIGNTYYFQQSYAKSAQFYKDCIRICELSNLKNEQIYPYSLSGAGASCYFTNNYQLAAAFFEKSLETHLLLKMRTQECALWLAKCYKEAKDTVKMLKIISQYSLNAASI